MGVSTTEAPRMQSDSARNVLPHATTGNSVFSMPLWDLWRLRSNANGQAARLSDPCDGESSPSYVACGYRFYVVLYQSSSLPQSSVSFLKGQWFRGKSSPKRASIATPVETIKCQSGGISRRTISGRRYIGIISGYDHPSTIATGCHRQC